MSNRQERIDRRMRQRYQGEVYVHVKPTKRVLRPVPLVDMQDGFRIAPHPSRRELKRRHFRYEQKLSGRKAAI